MGLLAIESAEESRRVNTFLKKKGFYLVFEKGVMN